MTYQEYIQNIIDTRGQWNIPEGEYYEAHHIIPRCMGGMPKSSSHTLIHENLIWLYPEEHYEAHKLLALENSNNQSLLFSWNMLSNFNQITDEDYKELKIKTNEAISGENHPMYGKHPSLETRLKQSLARKGKKFTEQHCENLSKSHKGKVFTTEHKDKLKEGKIGDKNPNFGKTFSLEHKNKLGEAHSKKVICIETGEVYDSISKAAKILNISQSSISLCCLGRNKTAGGCHWDYYTK